MKINIKSTNIKLNEALYDYIERKIGELDKFARKVGIDDQSFAAGKPVCEAWVEIGKPSGHHKKGGVWYAEVQIKLPGKSLRAESENWDLRLAIDEVKDELQQQLKQYTQKQIAKYKRGARKAKKELKITPEAKMYKDAGERAREEGM